MTSALMIGTALTVLVNASSSGAAGSGLGFAAALISPLMAVVLGAGALGLIAGGLWLKGRQDGLGEGEAFGPPEEPPLLETTLLAPERVEDGRLAPGLALGGVMRTAALVLGVAALLGAGARFAPAFVEEARLAAAPEETGEPLPPPAYAQAPLPAPILADAQGDCVDAGAAHSGAFTVCGGGLALRFERLAFARDGERLFEPFWAGAGQRAVLAEAKGLPAPFTFDGRTGLIAPPGGDMAAYDAFVAIGFGDEETDGKAAKARAESRGYALQDFVLQSIRGEDPATCRSDVVVHAVSLGERLAPVDGPRPQPLLVGVRAESRINNDTAAVDDMLSALFERPEATGLIGLVPEAYGPWTVLSSERACQRPALAGVPF